MKSTFGELLRKKRQECGLSQYQLGRILKISDKAISKWENDIAKPKTQLLYQLSTILGITVDELLVGEECVESKKKNCFTKEPYEYLWNKAYDKLMERYAGKPSIEMIGRFEMEKLALMNSNMILFFDLISQISERAMEQGYPVSSECGIGASFVAYLLGASDINPLPAHYYCPVCKAVEFVQDVSDGWDLDMKCCRNCHTVLVRDGHNIPFEVYRHVIGQNAGFDLVISKDFFEEAEKDIVQYFSSYTVIILTPPQKVVSNRHVSSMVTYAIQTPCLQKDEGKYVVDSYDEYYEFISDKPYINLIFDGNYEKCIKLERLVNVFDGEIDFLGNHVQQTFWGGYTDVLQDLGLRILPQLFHEFNIKNFEEALQLYGIALCASAFSEDELSSYINRQVNLAESIAYRDDVFLHVCSKMKEHGCYEFGLAFRVMDQARKGVYCREGMAEYIRKLLLDIGVSEQYIACLEETKYLFPKTLGIIYIKKTLILLWYWLHYPKEYRYVFGESANDFVRKEE